MLPNTIMLSGGFDPVHDGHIEMINQATRYGDVVIILNSDEWLARKKGRPFMTFDVRFAVMLAIKGVKAVIDVDDSDGTVCKAIEKFSPEYFGNGGDRIAINTPELDLCRRIGVTPVFNLGGKVRSSSMIIQAAQLPVERPWGRYQVLYEDREFKVKHVEVKPHSATSMQRHDKRDEVWVFGNSIAEVHRRCQWHQLRNSNDHPIRLIEVQVGSYFGEDDIERAPVR